METQFSSMQDEHLCRVSFAKHRKERLSNSKSVQLAPYQAETQKYASKTRFLIHVILIHSQVGTNKISNKYRLCTGNGEISSLLVLYRKLYCLSRQNVYFIRTMDECWDGIGQAIVFFTVAATMDISRWKLEPKTRVKPHLHLVTASFALNSFRME